jgi:hypothetical protein
MTVSIGSVIQDTDYNGLVSRVRALLGNGSGQTGYGQTVPGLSTVADNSVQNIAPGEWNTLRTQINRASRHQSNADQAMVAPTSGRVIGANESGTSVTRVDTGGVITWTHNSSNTSMGVNDFFTATSNIETNAEASHPTQVTATTGRIFALSTRTSTWGGAGQGQTVNCIFEIVFDGGYNVTDSTGATVVASGADHRRHFFNTGGEIRISGINSNATNLKGSDWATMLQNMGQVVLGKNKTTVLGTGRARDGLTDVDLSGSIDSALGNYQLTTSRQIIFQRNGGGQSGSYAENAISIYARRNLAGSSITIEVELSDNDVGDKTGDGPAVDEQVVGTLGIGLDLRRSTGTFISVPEPSVVVANELFD